MRSHKRRRMFAELRPNSHILPSRTEPNIRPNSSAELRRLPNFGPSLIDIWCMSSDRTLNSETATVHWCMFDDNGETSSRKCSGVKEFLSGLTCMKWAAGYQVPLVRLWVVTNPLSLFPFSILVVSFLIPTDFECLLHVSVFNLISRVLCQDTVGIFCAPFTHNWMVWAKQRCHLHWGLRYLLNGLVYVGTAVSDWPHAVSVDPVTSSRWRHSTRLKWSQQYGCQVQASASGLSLQ